jgi:hypothetical protein
MDKLWKLAVVGLLGFLIGQLSQRRVPDQRRWYKRRQGDV